MRWTHFKMIGYIGIEDGLGLRELEIPFYKSKNNICLIVGKNGSGKSTLENALSPLPDSSTDYTPGVDAAKEGTLQLPDGTQYHFLITAPVDNNGNRKQTKAFMQKNGEELNPNGNITSYKEIVESEFDMDPNFISLTHLSSTDRGLADKRPAERKKYVSAIVDCLETYNGINKSLTKKSSIFKSHINSIASKINSVGDLETSKMNLQALEARVIGLEGYIQDTQAEISRCDAEISSKDKDGRIQDTYIEIANAVDAINKDLDILNSSLGGYAGDINSDIVDITNKISRTQLSIDEYNSKNGNLIAESEDTSRTIQLRQQRLQAMQSDFDSDNLMAELEKYTNIVSKQEEILKSCGLYGVEISKEEYIMIFSKMKDYRERAFLIMDCDDNSRLVNAIGYLVSGQDIYQCISDAEIKKDELINQLNDIKDEYHKYEGMMESLGILDKRPDNCSIDSCPFISKALLDASQNPKENIERLTNEIAIKERAIDATKSEIELLKEMSIIYTAINGILKDAQDNASILSKFHESYIFLDKNEFLTRLKNHNAFNEVEDCDKYIQLADSIDGYNHNKSVLNDLLAQKKIYDSKAEMIEELNHDIQDLYAKLSNAEQTIKDNNDSIKASTGLLEKYKKDLEQLQNTSHILSTIEMKTAEKDELKKRYLEIKQDIIDIKKYIDRSNRLRNELENARNEIEPLKRDRDQLKFSIMRAEEYTVELEEYQSKYNTVEMLKKFSSPSSGIQTVYMNMYMNKTISLANDLLKLLFGGYLELMPYVINQDEFRMPVKHGNGMISDDISSCSTAQICMISMVTTIALSLQSSGTFNIFRFDEIDGGLDTENRLYFMDTIKKISSELGIEQMVMISHSIEANTNGLDLILLPLPGNHDYDYSNSNVIYDYNSRK